MPGTSGGTVQADSTGWCHCGLGGHHQVPAVFDQLSQTPRQALDLSHVSWRICVAGQRAQYMLYANSRCQQKAELEPTDRPTPCGSSALSLPNACLLARMNDVANWLRAGIATKREHVTEYNKNYKIERHTHFGMAAFAADSESAQIVQLCADRRRLRRTPTVAQSAYARVPLRSPREIWQAGWLPWPGKSLACGMRRVARGVGSDLAGHHRAPTGWRP